MDLSWENLQTHLLEHLVVKGLTELTLIFQKKNIDSSVVPPAFLLCLKEIQQYKDGTVSQTNLTFFKELKFSNGKIIFYFKTHMISATNGLRNISTR